MQAADIFAVLEVERILRLARVDFDVHIFARVLRRAQA